MSIYRQPDHAGWRNALPGTGRVWGLGLHHHHDEGILYVLSNRAGTLSKVGLTRSGTAA